MTDRKEYQREWARKRRQKSKGVDKSPVDKQKVSTQSVDSVSTTIDWQDQVDKRIFEKAGRGVPVNGFVLVSRGLHIEDDDDRDRVVTEETWLTRLGQTCEHGFEGWTCKRCL